MAQKGKFNWNDAESSSQDSWFDDDQPAKKPQNEATSQPKTEQSSQQNSKKQQHHAQVQQSGSTKQLPNNDKPHQKPKYLKDEQIIQQILSKTIEENKIIKVVNALSKEAKEIIENIKTIKSKRQYGEGKYILYFNNQEDLIAFIREKIQHRYKFFLHPYIRSQRQKEERKEKVYKEKDRESKPEKQERKEHRKPHKYQNSREDRPKKDYNDHGKEEEGAKKNYIPKHEQKAEKAFQLDQNHLSIKSENFQINTIIAELKKVNIKKKYSAILIYPAFKQLNKIYELCSEIFKEFQFGLDKIDQSTPKIEITLSQTRDNSRLKLILDKLHKVQPDVYEKYVRVLDENVQNYFKKIGDSNINEISPKFNEAQFLRLFKDHYQEAFKKWSHWIIRAQNQQIEILLKLINKLKVSLNLNSQLQIGSQGQIPTATIKLSPGEQNQNQKDKKQRLKVDTSQINNYLIN